MAAEDVVSADHGSAAVPADVAATAAGVVGPVQTATDDHPPDGARPGTARASQIPTGLNVLLP